jgi:hypothetical protein
MALLAEDGKLEEARSGAGVKVLVAMVCRQA